MIKNIAMFCGLIAIVLLFGGFVFVANYGQQGSGVSETVVRELESFDRIALSEIGTVNVSFGDTQTVTVTTDDNLVDLVETVVENGRLEIRPTKAINPKTSLVINIQMPKLTEAQVAGMASLNIHEFNGPSLDVELAGACGITASGEVDNLSVELAGACRASLQSLIAKNAVVEIAGTGSAVVSASDSIDASAAGFASITCHGNPQHVRKDAAGISKVTIVGT